MNDKDFDLIQEVVKQTYRRAYAEAMLEAAVVLLPKNKEDQIKYLNEEVVSTILELGD